MFYHPFLPFLDRQRSPDDHYSASPLLFWTIISVGARRYQTDTHLLNSLAGPVTRLVWSTLADIPQSYHVVKALCLLCSWPFPTSSTSTDPTFMLCGMMMQVAMQLGLHRPSHTQDFSKFRVELIEEELRDKVRTWAICNVVAQRYVVSFTLIGLSADGLQRCNGIWSATIYSVRLDTISERISGSEFQAARGYQTQTRY